jgi:arabinogalactan endo-1,4-beta-galactosidase
MQLLWLSFSLILTLAACKKNEPASYVPIAPIVPAPMVLNPNFIRAVDLSFTPEIIVTGTQFKDNNQVKELTQIIKDKGINTVRLRVWHTPVDNHSSLIEVVDFAKQLSAKGFGIWLDFHYSDSWADPSKQTKPAAWKNAIGTVLKDSIYQYTSKALLAFKNAGVTIKMVQIGNEINGGFLWNDGRVGGTYDVNWSNYALLLKEGLRAVKDADNTTKTMIHYAGIDGADAYFNSVLQQGISFDYIGLSYYMIWHGKSLDNVSAQLNTISTHYQKPICIAETAYPFTLNWNDFTNNIVGLSSQLITGYDATIDGQNAYTKALITILKNLPQQTGMGICWWAPEWVSFKGPNAINGSTWENLCLFDFSNNALPALASLGSYQ